MREWRGGCGKDGASWAPLRNRSVFIPWQLDLARVKAVGFHDGEAIGLSVFHKPLSFTAGPLVHPVVRQISHKGAAKDQDDGEAKEEDNPHVPEVHNRVLVITVGVWILLIEVLVLQIRVFLPAYCRSRCPLSRHSGRDDHRPGRAGFPANTGSQEPSRRCCCQKTVSAQT